MFNDLIKKYLSIKNFKTIRVKWFLFVKATENIIILNFIYSMVKLILLYFIQMDKL